MVIISQFVPYYCFYKCIVPPTHWEWFCVDLLLGTFVQGGLKVTIQHHCVVTIKIILILSQVFCRICWTHASQTQGSHALLQFATSPRFYNLHHHQHHHQILHLHHNHHYQHCCHFQLTVPQNLPNNISHLINVGFDINISNCLFRRSLLNKLLTIIVPLSLHNLCILALPWEKLLWEK